MAFHSPLPEPFNITVTAGDPSPLWRLKIGTRWEHKLIWPCAHPPLAQESPLSTAQTIPPDDANHMWPNDSLFYSICLDFRNDYPVQEWELLLAMYHCYSSLSEGYTLSAPLCHTWVHFSSK